MGISVEIQIGRKLREMGDQFQQEHLQLVRAISDQTSSFLFVKADVNQMGKSVSQVCGQIRWFQRGGFCHNVR